MHNSGMRVSSIRRRTTHDSYAYVPCGCCAAYYHSPLSLSLSSSPGFSLCSYHLVPMHSADFLAVGQHRHHRKICCAPRCRREWVERARFPLGFRSLRERSLSVIASQQSPHRELVSRNVEKIDYILSMSGIIETWRKLSEWSRKLFEIIFDIHRRFK